MARVGLSFSDRSENRAPPGAMPIGDLSRDTTEHDEDARLPGGGCGRESATSPSAPATAEGRHRPGDAGASGGRPGRVVDAERDRGSCRLRLEATDPTVGRMANSPDAQGRTVSGEAIYQYIYATPRGELARRGSSCSPSGPSAGPARAAGSGAAGSWGWCPCRSGDRMQR